jgi:hypothetical protein
VFEAGHTLEIAIHLALLGAFAYQAHHPTAQVRNQ